MKPELPTHAGNVELKFGEKLSLPRRLVNDNILLFPLRDGMRFHPLKDGEQFLITYPEEKKGTPRIPVTGMSLFGGMDESPFITALDKRAVEIFLSEGEDAFFEGLIPTQIKSLQKIFPESITRRQGDIWSIGLPFEWDDLTLTPEPQLKRLKQRRDYSRKEWRKVSCRQEKVESSLGDSGSILGTSHSLSGGKYILRREIQFDEIVLRNVVIGDGDLHAPDHAPQRLSGPHILARTPYIKSTRWARATRMD